MVIVQKQLIPHYFTEIVLLPGLTSNFRTLFLSLFTWVILSPDFHNNKLVFPNHYREY